jgi:hypothetical protein
MKNRSITYGKQQAQIYEAYYKPSFNMMRFTKSILAVILYGQGAAAPSYSALRKKPLR